MRRASLPTCFDRRLPVLLIVLLLLISSCVSSALVLSDDSDTEIAPGIVAGLVYSPGGDPVLILGNETSEEQSIDFEVLESVLYRESVEKWVQTGVIQVEVCDPVTGECYYIDEPVYEKQTVIETVYAEVRIEADDAVISPGGEMRVDIRILNSDSARGRFTVHLLVRCGDSNGITLDVPVAYLEP